jgi:hypothetical protein
MMRSDGTPVLVRDALSTELVRAPLTPKGGGAFDEAWLQRLIHDHPSCLPMREIEPGFGPVRSVCMELPTPRGLVDNLAMTSDGDIVMVEAKLWRNPEARRKVVAQALDYATCLFEMDYAALESAVLKADFGKRLRPASLVEIFAEPERPEEATFVDAVSRNLSRGRIVVLVVGDGIRSETERLRETLQSHAGFHFTFALVELAVFQLPNEPGYLVCPSTLAKTRLIERGVVRIDDARVRVTPPSLPDRASAGAKSSITVEQFFEAMSSLDPTLPETLERFMSDLAAVGVYPEYKRSLNLKWDPPSGKPINLGYIMRDGQVWTEATNWAAPHEISHAYEEEVANALGGEVDRTTFGDNWHVRIDGRVPRIDAIADRLGAWQSAIERFVRRLQNHYARLE